MASDTKRATKGTQAHWSLRRKNFLYTWTEGLQIEDKRSPVNTVADGEWDSMSIAMTQCVQSEI